MALQFYEAWPNDLAQLDTCVSDGALDQAWIDSVGSDLLIRVKQIMELRENSLDSASGVAGFHDAFGWM